MRRVGKHPRTCAEDDCDRPVYAKKLCRGHYGRALNARRRESPGRSPGGGKARPRGRESDVPAATRKIVLQRCGDRCEACGEILGAGAHLHHRLRRAQANNHSPANLVAVHAKCHVLAPGSIHERPAAARERGLLVRSGFNPADVPVVLPDGRRVLLDPENPRYLSPTDGLPYAA